MRRTRFDDSYCPIARTTDLLGDWWTPILLRELFYGRRRFDEFIDALDISRAVLSSRLKRLEAEGIVDRVRYDDHPPRHEYRLTDKGRALWDVLAAMFRYGDDWLFDDAADSDSDGDSDGVARVRPELFDQRTGERIQPRLIDENTGAGLDLASTRLRFRSRTDESTP